jgi:tetratricopeptide (TPR) repeat protein
MWALRRQAQENLSLRRWRDAEAPLKKLIELCPHDAGPASAYRLLAHVYRELGETANEINTLETLADLDASAMDAYQRLIELHQAKEDWESVARNAKRALAVNPLLPAPQSALATASEQLRRPHLAIGAYRALLAMDPVDPAEAHYRLAKLLQETGQLRDARRHVLQALEEAPRYRDAHRTLLEIVEAPGPDPEPLGLGVSAR